MTAQEIVRANRDAKVGREARPLVGGSNRGGVEAPSKPFFQALSKSRLFCSKLFQRKPWRFCGISTGCKPPDPTMTFLQIFRRSRLPSALFPPLPR
jgi:hypothetical protein